MSEKPEIMKKYVENDLEIFYDIISNYKHLINLKKHEKEINKKNIFKIILNNNGINTRQIHDILEENTRRNNIKVEQTAQKLYDEENINSLKEKSNFIKKYKEKTIVMRTIQILVKELQKEKMIIKQEGKFYIDKYPNINSPYTTEKYGSMILEQIFKPSNFYSEKQLTLDLVNKFGLIVLFNFITALQDIRERSVNKVINPYEDVVEIHWLKNVISIENMYSYFTTIIEQYEKQNKENIQNIQISNKLLNIIKSEYPSISSILSEVKNQFINQE